MSATATTACSMCHGSGYTVAGTLCSCGSLAIRLTQSNKSDQAHLALLRAELAIIRAKLEAAEKENARLAENLQDHDNSSKLIDSWCAEHDGKIPWNKAVEITAILTKMPEAERMRLLHLDPEKSMEEALADQAAQIEALEKDAARLDWFERMFVHSWNGVIGTGSSPTGC